jgi:predicted GNAT family acetyltransferase
MSDEVEVVNARERSRYELLAGGVLAGFSEYEASEAAIRFVHTEVLPGHAGKGFGSRLAAAAVADARASGKPVVADCTFIAAWLAKHPAPPAADAEPTS